jgi:HK97 family phage portal protein
MTHARTPQDNSLRRTFALPVDDARSIADSWADYERRAAGAVGFVPHAGATWDTPDDFEAKSGIGFALDSAEAEEILTGHGGGLTRSGLSIGPSQMLRCSAAYACRRVISEDVAKMGRAVLLRRQGRGRRSRSETVYDHPVHELLTVRPNDWMTPFEFVQYMVAIATFHRAAYALVQRDPWGNVTELLPLLPGTCAPEYKDEYWNIQYRITGYGETIIREPGDVFVLRGPMAEHPWEGFATTDLAREAVGLAAAVEAQQARFYANDLRPSGILTTELHVSQEQRLEMRKSWMEAYGPGGQGGVAVLDQKFKFEPIPVEGAKQEIIENRKFQVSDICRFFRVFPQMIGHNDGSQSYASVEQMFTAHVVHTLQPWVIRLEQAATLTLLTEQERRSGLCVDLDMDELLRGTPLDRANFYDKATKVYLTPNEARIEQGYDPLDDPAMDRVQLPANNTGLFPGGSASPLGGPSSTGPAKPSPGGPIDGGPLSSSPDKPRLPPPAPAKDPLWMYDEDERARAYARTR